MTKSDKSLESLCSWENTTVLSTAIITLIRNIFVFKVIIWTMAVLTNISTIAAVTQISAVEICLMTFASVGRTSPFRTATFAGALYRYSKPLLDSWLSLQFALGQLVLVEVSRTEPASF